MARRVQALELDAAPDTDEVALRESPIHAADAARGAGVRQDLRAGCGLEALVSAGVILVLVCVDDLRDLPAVTLRGGKAQLPLERIDRQRLSGLGTGDQIMKITQRVPGPDPFGEHGTPRVCRSQ